MKNFTEMLLLGLVPLCISCTQSIQPPAFDGSPEDLTLPVLARIMAELPMDVSSFNEVHDAVSSSSSNGYDEEYMMKDLVESPGAGVGADVQHTRASSYSRPLRDMFADYFSNHASTRSGHSGVQVCMDALASSDMQIYWPYSENWDGTTPPVISFDPENGADSNYGYDMETGSAVLVEVTEEMAKERPVWIINMNDDSGYTPIDFFEPADVAYEPAAAEGGKMLYIKSIKMLRHYDSWFGGASEFFVRCGAVEGFRAQSEEEMRNYSPEITDFMIVVKRKQLGKTIPFNAILLSDYTDQMEKMAFLVTEDDGGTRTSWKCEAVVKYNSKSYGLTLNIPYNEKDDIVWRGQLASSFFQDREDIEGRFGDVVITFGLL